MRKLFTIFIVFTFLFLTCTACAGPAVNSEQDTPAPQTPIPTEAFQESTAEPTDTPEATPVGTPLSQREEEASPAVIARMNAELSSLGNLMCNLQNNGTVTYDNEWIYYIPDSGQGSIYRHRFDGSGGQLVAKATNPWNLSLHGDWLYFQNYTSEDMTTSWLTRAPKTGGRVEQIYPMDDVVAFVIMDNVLYYTNMGSDEVRQGLYRMPLSLEGKATEPELLVPDMIAFLPDPVAKQLYTYQGAPEVEVAEFVAYDLEGQYLGPLWESLRVYPLQVGEDFVYMEYGNTTTLNRRRLGSEPEPVDDGPYLGFLPNGQTIFLLTIDDGLMRAPGLGRVPTTLRSEPTAALQFAGDWVYFSDNTGETGSGKPNWRLNSAIAPYTAEEVK